MGGPAATLVHMTLSFGIARLASYAMPNNPSNVRSPPTGGAEVRMGIEPMDYSPTRPT